MDDIKKVIANNLIKLRKKNNLTQNELAEKLNYSDNAVSRWERGEVTPSVETLQQISIIFNVPISTLLEGDALAVVTKQDKKQQINKLSVILIFVSIIWFIATVIFVYGKVFFNLHLWQVFIWSVPLSVLIMIPFNEYWGKYIYKFVLISIFQWSLLACIYIQFIAYNLWLVFIIGIPVQAGLAIWAFIKPKKK